MLELGRRVDALPPLELPANAKFLTTPIKVSGGKKFMNLFMKVTH
jgi:hypothetical protein